jgi:hypothetical protein
MPKAPQRRDPAREAALAERTEFEAGFRRSKKGNLWRHFEGMTLTIFGRDDERFGWCLVDAEGDKRFSRGSYESEEDALGSLADDLSIGCF